MTTKLVETKDFLWLFENGWEFYSCLVTDQKNIIFIEIENKSNYSQSENSLIGKLEIEKIEKW